MPQLNINEKDLGLTYDGTPNFTGGHFSSMKPTLIPENASALLLNVDTASNEGEATTRRGTRKIYNGSNIGVGNKVVGLYQHDFGTFNDGVWTAANFGLQTIVAASSGAALMAYRRRESDNAWRPLSGSWTGSTGNETRAHFAELGYRLYAVNGVSRLHSFDKNGGTFIDEGDAGNGDLPTASRQIVNHTNRLVAVGPATEHNTLYFSQFGNGTVWDKTLWNVAVGRKYNPITGIVPWTNHDLVVLKDQSIWIVNCNPETTVANFSMRTAHSNIGCVCPHTAVQVGDDVWFLTRQGIMIVERTAATDTRNQITFLASEEMQDVFNRINWDKAPEIACAFFWNNRYVLGLPLMGSVDPNENTWIVCNAKTRKWMGSWGDTVQPRFFGRFDGANPGRLRWANAFGQVFEWFDYIMESDEVAGTFTDGCDAATPFANGTAIPTSIVGRAYTFREPKAEKDMFDATIEFNKSLALAQLSVKLDGKPPEVISSFGTGGADVVLPVNLDFELTERRVVPITFGLSHLPPFMRAQLQIDSASGKLNVSSIEVSAFVASSHASNTRTASLTGSGGKDFDDARHPPSSGASS